MYNWGCTSIYWLLSYPFKPLCVSGAVFVAMWKRREAKIAFTWDLETQENIEQNRPEYEVKLYYKVTGCLSVCSYRRIPLTAEPVWLIFTG